MRITVLIPAYNEAAVIAETVISVQAQTRPADEIIVVADNCTDDTVAIARSLGANVLTTQGNRDKKGGALNQALDRLLPTLDDDDAVLVMDADTTLEPSFLESTAARMAEGVGGVGGIFTGRPGGGLLGTLQRMEFHRYARQIRRLGGLANVLTGTGTLFNVGALRAVQAARGDRLPSGDGVYDTHSLTEDNELTLALRTIGFESVSPGPRTVTDVMTSPVTLYHQRHRWYLGALRNLRRYGTRLPWHLRWTYWRQQFGLTLSAFGVSLYLCMLLITALIWGTSFPDNPIWLAPLAVLMLERTITVWRMGWRERLLAVTVLVEQLYTLLLLTVFVGAMRDFLLGRKGGWRVT